MNYKEFFSRKKILIMGLGILGRGVNIAKFLAERGAELTITDLKTKEQLASSLKKLQKFSNIKYVLGKHELSDFRSKDMLIKAAGVPLDSLYIAETKKNKIPIEMDASLFVKLINLSKVNVNIIGITGTRGKSTVTHLIYDILERAFKKNKRKVYLGGNVKGLATLPLLKKVKSGDIVVMELDSWQLQGFGDSQISPNIAVFTTFLRDHQNYYKNDMERYFSDKANIYRCQKKDDWLIMRPSVAKTIREKDGKNIKGQTTIIDAKDIPKNWKIRISGRHNLENIALAVSVARKTGVKDFVIKKSVENFKGLHGRLEFVREIEKVKYYNDTTATTPEAVIAALDSLKENKGKIILIGGGADKNLEYGECVKVVKKYAKAMILFKGVATDKIIKALGKAKFSVELADNMREALKYARARSNKGDIVLLSPGAASFGVFKNEFDRGDKFNKLVKRI